MVHIILIHCDQAAGNLSTHQTQNVIVHHSSCSLGSHLWSWGVAWCVPSGYLPATQPPGPAANTAKATREKRQGGHLPPLLPCPPTFRSSELTEWVANHWYTGGYSPLAGLKLVSFPDPLFREWNQNQDLVRSRLIISELWTIQVQCKDSGSVVLNFRPGSSSWEINYSFPRIEAKSCCAV